MKGICFIPPLHDKTVKRLKTETRRIMPIQPDDDGLHNHSLYPMSLDSDLTGFWGNVATTGESKEFKPRYKIGEVLYLKEPYATYGKGSILYKYSDAGKANDFQVKWQNKLFMPASAARYFIKITNIRAERLQDISDEDCLKEGIFNNRLYPNPIAIDGNPVYYHNGLIKDGFMCSYSTPKKAYAALIDKINGKGTWDSNPFVWAYDYELINKKEDGIK